MTAINKRISICGDAIPFILSVGPQHQEAFETLIGRKAQHIGKVTETGLIIHALDDVINCSTKRSQSLMGGCDSMSYEAKA